MDELATREQWSIYTIEQNSTGRGSGHGALASRVIDTISHKIAPLSLTDNPLVGYKVVAHSLPLGRLGPREGLATLDNPTTRFSREEGTVAKADRGFASMDRNKQRELASQGGKAAHQKGTAHEWTSEEAREAGRRGGKARHRHTDQHVGETTASWDIEVMIGHDQMPSGDSER
jgi:uncharacterized protein